MAKDADKRRVLVRRKRELDHAITHNLSSEILRKRAEKLRAAAIAVLKKCRDAFAHIEGAPGNSDWESIKAKWDGLSVEQIINLSTHWNSQPTLKDLQFKGLENALIGRQAANVTDCEGS